MVYRTTGELQRYGMDDPKDPDWVKTLAWRQNALEYNKEHRADYTILPRTREEIVAFYERAYSEVVDDVRDKQRQIEELQRSVSDKEWTLHQLRDQLVQSQQHLGQTGRRLWALLELLETNFYKGVERGAQNMSNMMEGDHLDQYPNQKSPSRF